MEKVTVGILLFDGVEKARGELKPLGDGQKGVVELVGIPEKPGEMKVTIEDPAAAS